jgi:hypothetical protein
MQAGRLLDIKPFGMNAVPLVLGRHNAQATMFCVHLHSTTLTCLYFTLNGDLDTSEPYPGLLRWGRATGARGDREC